MLEWLSGDSTRLVSGLPEGTRGFESHLKLHDVEDKKKTFDSFDVFAYFSTQQLLSSSSWWSVGLLIQRLQDRGLPEQPKFSHVESAHREVRTDGGIWS